MPQTLFNTYKNVHNRRGPNHRSHLSAERRLRKMGTFPVIRWDFGCSLSV
jgi:hypothetical protein